jgi:hypothetical protein
MLAPPPSTLYSHPWLQALPQLVPRTTLEFPCLIGESQVKGIDLSNPSRNLISYNARLEGSSDFVLESSTIKLEAKGTTRINVTCTPSSGVTQEAK